MLMHISCEAALEGIFGDLNYGPRRIFFGCHSDEGLVALNTMCDVL